MSEFRIDQIKSQDATRGPDVAGITTFTGTSGIVMPSGDTAYRGGRGRGIFGGGYNPTLFNIIEYITIASTGDAVDFGDDLSATKGFVTSASSSTRGLTAGGYAPGYVNVIDYYTISSTGNAFDFGDLLRARRGIAGASSNTRGIWFSGTAAAPSNDPTKDIEYITISSTGNASAFGELDESRVWSAAFSSPVRGVCGGGRIGSSSGINSIEYVTISTNW